MTDKRSRTSKINGVKGGRPVESSNFEPIEGELWSPISEFPMYMVSTEGRVMSIKSGRLRKPQSSKGGYLRVKIGTNPKTPAIHRLVLEAFVGKSNMQVDHIDMVKTNNKLENLEYVTREENMRRIALHPSMRMKEGATRSQSKINPWRARLSYNGERIYLGCYSSKELALQARQDFLDEACRKELNK